MKTAIIIIVILLIIWFLFTWLSVRSIEEPLYTIVSQEGEYEIRIYEPYIIAQTTVNGTYRDSLNSGFSIIADYIFGNNTASQKIAMTTPVVSSDSAGQNESTEESASKSQKIAMTTPVISEGDSNEKKVSFVMPSEYTLETIPKPNSDRVILLEVPARKVAVLRYTWYATESRVATKKAFLAEKLTADDVVVIGGFASAQYNPPLSIPFLLRNEIIVEIE